MITPLLRFKILFLNDPEKHQLIGYCGLFSELDFFEMILEKDDEMILVDIP